MGTTAKDQEEVEELKTLSLTKGPSLMLDTTRGGLELVNADRSSFTKDQLLSLVDDLVHLTIQQRDQIRNDISLIADLDENCFRFAHKREEIKNLKRFIDSMEDLDKVKQKYIYQYKKLLEDKKEELNN